MVNAIIFINKQLLNLYQREKQTNYVTVKLHYLSLKY